MTRQSSTTYICGTGTRCERHERALHGYPCHACAEEHWRRYPRTRALIHQQASGEGPLVTPAQFTAARKQDESDRSAYAGPHTVIVLRAGDSGPVMRLWNATCTDGCGWSHYWLRSATEAHRTGRDHLRDAGVLPPLREGARR